MAIASPDSNVNTLYTLPDEQGYRKEIKVYSYTTNPCLVIFVNKVKKLNKKYYQSALYDTIIEAKQAVEGMYHNLKIWA